MKILITRLRCTGPSLPWSLSVLAFVSLVALSGAAGSVARAAEGEIVAPAAAEPEAPAAQVAATPPPPVAEAVHTRSLNLSYRGFSISDGGTSRVPLTGLELGFYPLSTRFVRGGLTVGVGHGHGAVDGTDVGLRYGMLGLVGGLQIPGRITPFIEGNLSAGVMTGSLNGALTVPGTSVSITGGSAATYLYTRGVDLGLDLYTFGSFYLSGSIGWLRTTWRGVDIPAMNADPAGGLKLKSLTDDSLAFKIGLGF